MLGKMIGGGLVAAGLLAVISCGGSTSNDDGGSGGSSSGGSSSGGSSSGGSSSGGSSSGGSSSGGSGGAGGGLTCEGVCNTVLPDDCPSDLLGRDCVEECNQTLGRFPSECRALVQELFECVQAAARDCRDPEGPCDEIARELADCGGAIDPCSDLESFGFGSSEGSFNVVVGACGCDDEGGSPPGSACSTSSDCAEVCCGCGSDGPDFGVRACMRGRCLDGPEACNQVISSSPDVCS